MGRRKWARGGGKAVSRARRRRGSPKDGNGRTLLSRAAESGQEEVVRLLVKRDDIKADSKDKDGLDAAVVGCREGERGGSKAVGGAEHIPIFRLRRRLSK